MCTPPSYRNPVGFSTCCERPRDGGVPPVSDSVRPGTFLQGHGFSSSGEWSPSSATNLPFPVRLLTAFDLLEESPGLGRSGKSLEWPTGLSADFVASSCAETSDDRKYAAWSSSFSTFTCTLGGIGDDDRDRPMVPPSRFRRSPTLCRTAPTMPVVLG